MDSSAARAWRTDPAQSIGTAAPPAVPSPRRVWLWVLLLAAAATLYLSQRVPCEPQAGVALTLPAAATPVTPADSLRLATFNIHGGKGLDGVRDLSRIAACLEGFDFVGLQEVHGAYYGWGPSQAQTLGETLNCGWLFAPAVRQWGHYEFGNALLSRAPVAHWQTLPLTSSGKTYQNAVLATVPLGSGTVRVVVTHVNLKHPVDREAQLRTVIHLFESLAAPAVLMGDLNTGATDPQLSALLNRPGVRDGIYAPLGIEATGIDWIITRGLRTKAAGVGERGPSDHPRLWAEVELAP